MAGSPLFIYNTLKRQKQEFIPLDKKHVNMYVCGITPYDDTHLGHARCYVSFDIVRRYLQYKGFDVTYVQNVTDVDDKIIKRAQESGGDKPIKESCRDLAGRYFSEYVKLMSCMGVKEPSMFVKATETITQMHEVIKALIEKGFAYEVDGDVYFCVRKFKSYGKLSGRDVDQMKSGARVQVDENKKDPLDFALWKKAKEGEPSWESPWGKGRPGWHIECSVMSLDRLKTQTLDIHGGGQDLIFPHHENEIAQSEAYTGKPFVQYWIHNGFVTVDKEKMSKSLGNFFTLKDIFKKYEPQAVRLFLLSQHYRSPIDFSDQRLEEAQQNIRKFENFNRNRKNYLENIQEEENIKKDETKSSLIEEIDAFKRDFIKAMDDDFNTAIALSHIYKLINYANKKMDQEKLNIVSSQHIESILSDMSKILGLQAFSFIPPDFDWKSILTISEEEVDKLIAMRLKYRREKKYQEADQIRKDLESKGIILEDTAQGTRWKIN
ncbi:MAG: cysteine--tRNA ligase [bacterium]